MSTTPQLLVTILYPSVEGATFDLEYYNNKHLPLVAEKWGKHGLTSYYVADLRGAPGPYSIQSTIIWEGSIETFQRAATEDGAEVHADVANFSSEKPIALVGPVVKSQI
ncbi:hypothetical protein SLS53_004795 [Cytospora paraplurivora]|uniref:EthD domain-containing protein n=2 Tax=Cytospora TaxID=117544 RepID=A0A423XDB4_9PEZI|nr:hypothetical protein VPNG_04043 [Cytospora leucostoma]